MGCLGKTYGIPLQCNIIRIRGRYDRRFFMTRNDGPYGLPRRAVAL